MLVTLLEWCFFTLSFFLLGWLCQVVARRIWGTCQNASLSALLWAGIVLATVYAETVSLFGKVGVVALGGMLAVEGLVVLWCHREIRAWIANSLQPALKGRSAAFWCIAAFICLLGAFLAAKVPVGFDAYNYHAPTIRWAEEFGVVKGLGNLHSRFAYNSAFICLQALHSFAWVHGVSHHSLNGFLWVFSCLFCLAGLRLDDKKRLPPSSMLRLACLCVLFSGFTLKYMSDPGTDVLPCCAISYVFIKWCDFWERGEKSPIPFALLGLLGVFAVSAKLSAIVASLFFVKPFLQYCISKQWRNAVLLALLATLVLLPFLIRNVMLSGYLLYPVPALAWPGIDWKMPLSILQSDQIMILVCARMNGHGYAYENMADPFSLWFPRWLAEVSLYHKAVVIASFVLLIPALWILLRSIRAKKRGEFDPFLLIPAMGGFLFFMTGAPALRFGEWWLWVLPALFLGKVLPPIQFHISKRCKQWTVATVMLAGVACLAGLVLAIGHSSRLDSWLQKETDIDCTSTKMSRIDWLKGGLVFPADWCDDYACAFSSPVGGIPFYYFNHEADVPSGLNGYRGFPGSPRKALLEKVELRGDSLKDGFRVRPEWQDRPFDFEGQPFDYVFR